MFTVPPVESVGEFKMESANYSAEDGHTGGGVEIFSTKSGTNQFHGSLFEYLRNDKFDARGFISPTTPINRQNEFGVDIGGPGQAPALQRQESHLLLFCLRWIPLSRLRDQSLFTLPTAAQRDGDFSGLTKAGGPLQIYDPASTTTNSAGNFTRTIFPNAQIPVSRMSKVAVAMLGLLPAASNAAVNNYTSVGAAVFNRNAYTFKIDHSFSDRSRISLFGYADVEDSIDAPTIQGAFSPALDTKRPDRWLRFNHDFSFSGTLLNNFRAGYTHAPQVWARVATDYLQKVGLTGVNPPDNVLPQINFADTYYNLGNQIKNVGEAGEQYPPVRRHGFLDSRQSQLQVRRRHALAADQWSGPRQPAGVVYLQLQRDRAPDRAIQHRQ